MTGVETEFSATVEATSSDGRVAEHMDGLLIDGDPATARKYLNLSEKYSE